MRGWDRKLAVNMPRAQRTADLTCLLEVVSQAFDLFGWYSREYLLDFVRLVFADAYTKLAPIHKRRIG